MRSFVVSACALLMLSGCGGNAQGPPQAAINSSPNGTNPQTNKERPPDDPQTGGAKNTNANSQTKPSDPPNAGGPGFAPDDPEQTLRWLIRTAAKVRATPPADKAALDRAWADYTHALKTAHGQKIRWELQVRDVNKAGVSMEEVKAAGNADCRGLRVKPAQQPDDGIETFILRVPDGPQAAGLSRGTRALVSGVITQIDSTLRQEQPQVTPYEFAIRLADYTVTPVK